MHFCPLGSLAQAELQQRFYQQATLTMNPGNLFAPSHISLFIVIFWLTSCYCVLEGHNERYLMVGACWGCSATIQQEMENTASSMRKDQQYPQKSGWEVECLSRIDRKPTNITKIRDKWGKADNRSNLSLQRREHSQKFTEDAVLKSLKRFNMRYLPPLTYCFPFL